MHILTFKIRELIHCLYLKDSLSVTLVNIIYFICQLGNKFYHSQFLWVKSGFIQSQIEF